MPRLRLCSLSDTIAAVPLRQMLGPQFQGSTGGSTISSMRTRFASNLLVPVRLIGLLAWGAMCPLISAEESTPPVNILLWFDTEDYLLPSDDDATRRLCEMLTQRGIRATFKMVGEKARVLERRGR